MESGGVSSLVFLVVIGVWAAYFIQYWVRRRDHLATARSVDQFSESMRVLERRTALPAADVSTPQGRAHAVGPAGPARPQLLVRRAVTSAVAASVDDGAVAGVAAAGASGPASGPPRTRAAGRGTAQETARATARAAARRNRAMLVLGALSTWLVAVPLVGLGLLGWAYLAVPVASLVATVGWVRRSARRARRTRPAARSQSRVHDAPTTRPEARRVVHTRPGQHAPASAGAPAEAVVAGEPAEREPAPTEAAEELAGTSGAEPSAATAPVRRRGELYDLQAIEAASAGAAATPAVSTGTPRPARPLVDEDDIPLTWDPVPVPRPTYTLKARATRPAPAAADLVGDADTEYAAREDDVPVRQVAGA